MSVLNPKIANQSSKRHQNDKPKDPKGPNFWFVIFLIVLIAMLYGMSTGDRYYFDKMVEVLGKFASSSLLP